MGAKTTMAEVNGKGPITPLIGVKQKNSFIPIYKAIYRGRTLLKTGSPRALPKHWKMSGFREG